MGRLGNINNYVAAQSDAKKQEVNQQYDQQQQVQQQPVQQQPPQAPISQPSIASATNSNPMAGAEQVDFREKTLQNLDENDFKARQGELNASDKEYWGAKLRQNPENTYTILREYFASDETPEAKAKRERRDKLGETFRNLGNVIGNAANLYSASQGGVNIDLNSENEKRIERMRKLQEKNEAIQRQRDQMFANAKMNDLKNEQARRAAEAKAKAEKAENERKRKHELVKMEIENQYKLGYINAETKADLLKQAEKAKTDKELENLKHKHDVSLKRTLGAEHDKVITSLTGSDGVSYTRRTKLDDFEIRELAKYVENWDPYVVKDALGNIATDEKGNKIIDYAGAIADAAESGMIPTEVLEEKGFKKGKSTGKKSISGFGSGKRKIINGF